MLAIATNVPILLMNGFVVLGHNFQTNATPEGSWPSVNMLWVGSENVLDWCFGGELTLIHFFVQIMQRYIDPV